MPIKEFKIVEIGNYVCAIKLGRCPIFAVENKSKKDGLSGSYYCPWRKERASRSRQKNNYAKKYECR